MSEEMVKMSREELIASLRKASSEDKQFEEALRAANPFKVMQQLKLDGDQIVLYIADERKNSFDEIYFIAVLITGSRALWYPEDNDDNNTPVCATRNSPIDYFSRNNDRAVGHLNLREDFFDLDEYLNGRTIEQAFGELNELVDGELPVDKRLKVRCSECPWNQYGSKELWGGSGGGKACNEGRMMMGFPALETQDNGLYEMFGKRTYFRLGASSIKSIQGMINSCVGNDVANRFVVFKMQASPKSKGPIKWSELKAKMVGYNCSVEQADKELLDFNEMIFDKEFAPKVDAEVDF